MQGARMKTVRVPPSSPFFHVQVEERVQAPLRAHHSPSWTQRGWESQAKYRRTSQTQKTESDLSADGLKVPLVFLADLRKHRSSRPRVSPIRVSLLTGPTERAGSPMHGCTYEGS